MKEIKTSFSLCSILVCLMLFIVAGCSNETEPIESVGSSKTEDTVLDESSAESDEDIPSGWSKGDDNVYSGYVIGVDKDEVLFYITDMTGSSSVIEHLASGTAVSVKTEDLGVADISIRDSVKFKIKAYDNYPQSNFKTGLDVYVVCYSKISIIEYTPMR